MPFLQAQEPSIKLTKIASGFTSPIGLFSPRDGTNRLFVIEQRGRIYIVKNGQIVEQPFLNISHRIDGLNVAYSEKGLLGLAFHPDYKKNGRFFVYYSAPLKQQNADHLSVLAEYRVNPDNPDAAIDKEVRILEIPQPESNHNGGMLAFGPDGYLYIGLGDGGGANDEHGTIGNGQNMNTLLGKILRINVDGKKPYEVPADNPFVGKAGHKPEIWASGLRNPWRFSFDRATGRLLCGDVGQNKYEEINIIRKGGNYGWRIMEGNHCFNPENNCNTTGLVMPLYEYNHDAGISICGGYVYRGEKYPGLKGYYFFGDWTGKLFCLTEKSELRWTFSKPVIAGSKGNDISGRINSFGEDENGEIYIVTQISYGPKNPTGAIYRIEQ
jgi:glucose/arabinose dehydrogenase